MSNKEITDITNQWTDTIHQVLALEEVSKTTVRQLLKETYRMLTDYHKLGFVPKEIIALFLEMEDFLYFTSIMEGVEKEENFYNWQENFCIIKALEKGFLEGEYECDFPKLIIKSKKKLLVDFDSDTIEDYIVAFNELKNRE